MSFNQKNRYFYCCIFFLLILVLPIYHSHVSSANISKRKNPTHRLNQIKYTFTNGTVTNLSFLSSDPLAIYFSSDSNVASVSNSGILTTHKPGITEIIYSNCGKFYQCSVQVIEPYSPTLQKGSHSDNEPDISFQIEESLLFMEKGDSYKVNVSHISGGSLINLNWSSDDASVARVDQRGTITACGRGSTTITCHSGNVSEKVYINVVTADYSGKACDFSILTETGATRTYRLFKQNAHNYPKYDSYLAWHGCATCSLASVLGAYNPSYNKVFPSSIIDGAEKQTVDASSWNREHVERPLKSQMPLSLFGISSILNQHNVSTSYVRSYSEQEAKADIISHLKTGNSIIFEVRQKSNKTGKKSHRWTNSYHTMVFLGILTNGKVLLCDSIDRSWYDGGQRVKIVDLEDVMEFMFPCTSFSESMYYDGASSDGGYIKVYDSENKSS